MATETGESDVARRYLAVRETGDPNAGVAPNTRHESANDADVRTGELKSPRLNASSYGERLWNQIYASWLAPMLIPGTHRGLRQRLRKLDELQKLSLAQNRELQWQSLQRVLRHAYETTPFYKKRFDESGIQPSQISSPSDLEKIPPLTREDIRNNLDSLWSRRYRREELLTAATGGTTDSPVQLLRAPDCVEEKVAIQLHFDTWAGMWPGDKVLYLWGARSDYAQDPSWRWRIFDRYLMRRIWLPTSLLNPQVLESYRVTLNRFRPRIIYAYPTPLAIFCEYLLTCGRPYFRPVSAICTAEPLMDSQRLTIEKALGVPIFEKYGARDFGMIAGECEQHQGMHVNPESAYVELRPVEGAEIQGLSELLITDLLNYGMPLIRYKVNDCTTVSSERCACGRGFPLIGQIIGRTTENFVLTNGDVIPGVSLTNRVIQVCPGIRKLQIIQETIDSIRVRYVAGESFSSDDLANLQKKLDIFFGKSVHWTFEKTDDIERERSGKTRMCISRVTARDLKKAETR